MNANDEHTEPPADPRDVPSPSPWPVIVVSAVTAFAMVVGLNLTAVTGYLVGSREDQLAAANARSNTRARAQQALSEQRRQEYLKADLLGLYAEVILRNDKQRAEAQAWMGRDPVGRAATFAQLEEVQLSCEESLITYNYVAAKYSDLLTSDASQPMPQEIDTSDPLMNCWMTPATA